MEIKGFGIQQNFIFEYFEELNLEISNQKLVDVYLSSLSLKPSTESELDVLNLYQTRTPLVNC